MAATILPPKLALRSVRVSNASLLFEKSIANRNCCRDFDSWNPALDGGRTGLGSFGVSLFSADGDWDGDYEQDTCTGFVDNCRDSCSNLDEFKRESARLDAMRS